MNKNYVIGMFFYCFILISLIIAAIVWEVYKYKDCKKVGHSTIYCIFAKG